ncbi:xanthotoxin 5-hydroxylase CYP82C4-like [Aristolochia californica]|uniref:xanthotoxin 5-hydroxylase CYP82C4-like n=1 Tax=Aristolochia californica TaxID=171875 RepID=UPI0035D9BA4F
MSPYYAGFLVALTIFFIHYLWSKKRQQAHGKEAPEVPGSCPIIGHIPLLANCPNIHRQFAYFADHHGPAFTIHAGRLRILVVNTWELSKDCLFVNDRALADRPNLLFYEHFPPIFAFAKYGSFWRESRKILVQNISSAANLDSIQLFWISEVDHLVRRLYTRWVCNNRDQIDMKHELLGTMLNISTRIVARKRYHGSKEGDAEARLFIRLFEETLYQLSIQNVGDAFPFLRRFDLLGNERAMKKTGQEVDELMQKWVDEHRLQNKDSSSSTAAHDGGACTLDTDLIDMLLLKEKEGTLPNTYPSNSFIKGFIYAIIVGATDTSAITLMWALSLLVNNPHVLERAYAELDLHVGHERVVETSDLGKLVYLQSIIKEALRLYPPSPLLGPHRASEDCKVGDFHVFAGTTVMINAWKIQRDPRVFTNPLEFRPERFLEENRDMDVMGQQFILIPFGFGRRGCPGANMALRIVHLALARLLQAFDWTLLSGCAEVDMSEDTTTTLGRKHPLELIVVPRLSPELYK